MENTLNKRSYSIDSIKGLAAILIVCLHCANEDAFDSVIHLMGRMAVPMFFIITGYYLPSMIKSRHIISHITKILRITIAGLIIYTILYVVDSLLMDDFNYRLSIVLNFRHILSSLFLGRFPLSVNAGHLWYLVSVFYILVFVFLYTKRYKIANLYFLIPFLFCIGYVISSFPNVSRLYYQNYLFIGLPYVLLGSYIRDKDVSFSDKKIKWLIVIFSILYLTEIGFYLLIGLPAHREHYFCIIFLVSSILIWASNHPDYGEGSILAMIGKKYSIYIYVIHFYIVQKMWIIFHGSSLDSKWQMLSSIVLSLLVSYLYVKIKKMIFLLKHD